MISQISRSASNEAHESRFPKVPPKQIACQVQSLLEEVSASRLIKDSLEHKYYIIQKEAMDFAKAVLDYLVTEKFILLDEVEAEARSFFKMYFLKSGYQTFEELIGYFLSLLSDKLDKSIDNEPLASKAIAFLAVCSNWNSGAQPEKSIIFNGVDHNLRATFDKDTDSAKLFFNRDFTIVLNFKIDSEKFKTSDTSASILSYVNEYSEIGYSLYIQTDALWFRYVIPIKGPEMVTEFKVFDKVSDLIGSDWSCLFLQCQYNPSQKSSSLRFQLNNKVFLTTKSLEDAFSRSPRQTLTILGNAYFELALLYVINRALSNDRMQTAQTILLNTGVTSAETVDQFTKAVTDTPDAEGSWVFLHPFCRTIIEEDNVIMKDWFSGKKWILGAENHFFEVSGRKMRNSLLRLNILDATLTLFNFGKSEEDFASLLRVLRNLFSNSEFQSAISQNPKKFCRKLVSALVVTKKGSLFGKRAIEVIFYLIRSQADKAIPVFCRELLFDFNFLDKMLASDAVVTAYFEEATKLFNSNVGLFLGLDFDDLFASAILFLSQKPAFSHLKAFCLLKFVAQAMKIGDCADKFDIQQPLKYLFNAVPNQSLINMAILRIVKQYSKHRAIERSIQKLFVSALASLLNETDDGILIAKIFKLLMASKANSEGFLTDLWRKRLSENRVTEKTKKALWQTPQRANQIKNIDQILRLFVRKSFKDLPKTDFFNHEEWNVEKPGYFNLMLEVSLLSDQDTLLKFLLLFGKLTDQKNQEFLEVAGKSYFLNWLVVLIYRSDGKKEETEIYEEALRLLTLYCLNRYKMLGQLDHLNVLSELVTFYTGETRNERLKFVLITLVFEEMNRDATIFENKFLVASFLLFSFKYYFSNLADSFGDERYTKFANQFLALAHRTVNLNPVQTLPADLTEEVSWALLEKQKLITSLINSATFTSQGLESVKNGYVCPIKCLVITVSDILQVLVIKREDQPKLDTCFEFVNAFVYRLSYFLENNRKKTKADKIYLLESSAYEFISFALRQPRTFPHLKDLVEGMFYFVGKSASDATLNAKIMKALRVGQFTRAPEFYHSLKFDKEPKTLSIAEFANRDFDENKHQFLLTAVGKINEALTKSDMAYHDELFGSPERQEFSDYVDFTSGKQKYREMLNVVWTGALIRSVKINGVYHRLYSGQFEEGGRFFDGKLREKADIHSEFDPANFEYNPERGAVLQFRPSDYVCRGFKTPFIHRKYKGETPQLNYPKEAPFPENYKMADYLNSWEIPYFSCDQVCRLYAIPSFLGIDEKRRKLRVCLNVESSESIISKFGIEICKYTRKPYHKILKKIKLGEVRAVHLQKYLNQRKAVLVQTNDFQHHIFHFAEEAQAAQVVSLIQSLISKSPSNDLGGSGGVERGLTPAKLVESWLAHKVSNFDFLFQMNIFGCRSWMDYSQYPVFPLLLKKIDAHLTLRDLEKPVGMNADDKGLAAYQRTYDVSNPTEGKGFFYGSHYSCPANVFNLLVRKSPENRGSQAIHNNNYDFPDRIFFSVQVMTRNIVEDSADVRELVPEFFWLPEMFLNINNFDFGVAQHGQRVHNVELPPNSKANPYVFVVMLRQLLESPLMSLKLGSWVDLIFGYKQFGPKALEAKNVFFPLTYEQNFKSAKIENEEELKAKMNQIFNFGQTPACLFTKAVGNRKVTGEQLTLTSADTKTRYFLRFREPDTAALNPLLLVKKIKEKSMMEAKVIKRLGIIKRQKVEIWRFKVTANVKNNLNPYEMLLENTFQTPKIRQAFIGTGGCPDFECVMEFAGEQRILLGGLLNGFVLVANYKLDKVLTKQHLHDETISHMMFVGENQLLTADVSGVVKLSTFDSKTNNLSVSGTWADFGPAPLHGITVCRDDRRLLVINSATRYEVRSVDRFDQPLFVLHKRDIKVFPSNPSELVETSAFLSLNYLNCLVVFAYFNGRNHLYSFSMLGQMIGNYTLDDASEPMFSTFTFIPDENFRDHLLITNRRGDIMVFDVPFFEHGRKISSNQQNNVRHVSTFLKNKLAMVVDDRGYIDILSATQKEAETEI
jgi:hypothetical protein